MKKTNYKSHETTDDPADSLPVANRLSAGRIPLSKELNSPVPLSVANKKTEDSHPDDKWLKDDLIKITKCQPAARDTLSSGHTLHTVVVPVSCHILPGHTLHTVVVPVSPGHTVHTLAVTVQVPVRSTGHTVHTPRVTVQVPVSSHTPSGHTLHTPRVTVVVPVSCHFNTHLPHVHAKVPDSRLARQQNKNQQNEKMKKEQTNYLSNTTTNDLTDNLPVANKLSISRIPLSKELNSPVYLSVASKFSEDSVSHPDDKWLTDVQTKIQKCQPAARDALSSGHTLHTVVVPVSCHILPGHTLHTVVVPVSPGHTVHTLVVTVQVPVRSTGHTVHTPRVTVQVPVSSHTPSGHTLHTPRVTVVVPVRCHFNTHLPHVHAKVPDSRLARQQNKNKQNEKYKNQKSNYLSNVTVVENVKLTKLYNLSQVILVIPFILSESLFMSLLGLVIPFILRESLFRSLSVPVILFILCKSLFRSLSVLVIPFILRESLFRSLSVYTLKSTQQTHSNSSLKSQVSNLHNLKPQLSGHTVHTP